MSEGRRINSRDNPSFKVARAAAEDPRRHGCALLDGIHLVGSALRYGIVPRQMLATEGGRRNGEIAALLQSVPQVECLTLGDGLFREISGVSTPTGIAALIDIPAVPDRVPRGDVLMLDAVQDAGNVGAILRTAAAAGVHDVYLGTGCAGAWTPRVLRAGQGAHFSLAIRERADLPAVLAGLPQISMATVARGGTTLHEFDLSVPVAWLVGNEGAGLSAGLTAAATERVTIPLASGTESLNVAAAVAVCLFEARRQRLVAGMEKERPAQGGPDGQA